MRDNGPDVRVNCNALCAVIFFQDWCWNTEEHLKNVTKYFISSGLAKLGYTQINIGMLVLFYF